jgi:thiamine kinase-like enzyme
MPKSGWMPTDQPKQQAPVCRTVFQCGDSLLVQSRDLISYLESNPAVAAALRSSYVSSRRIFAGGFSDSFDDRVSALKYGLNSFQGGFEERFARAGQQNNCSFAWATLSSLDPAPILPNFEALSNVGTAALNKARSDYQGDAEAFKQLMATNDRYTGVEAFERIYAAYGKAFENDDFAAMLEARPAFLKELEVAENRKKLLTQQSAQIENYQQRLSDIAASVQHGDLTAFVDRQTQDAIDKLQNELEQLKQIAPAKRGDIAATLETLQIRIDHVDTEIKSATTAKNQAEGIKRTLVENEGTAGRILQSATGVDLRSAFDDQFAKSVNELIVHIRDLESIDLSAVRTKQEDIAAVSRKLNELQQRISEAQSKYDQAKKLDDERQSVMQSLLSASRDFTLPENRKRLSRDGVRIATGDVKSALDSLSKVDDIPLLSRSDYGAALTTANQTLSQLMEFEADIARISELSSAVSELNSKVAQSGRRPDGRTSGELANLNATVNVLKAATIPLTTENRSRLADASNALNEIQTAIAPASITVETFALDGRDLAAIDREVTLTGVYLREGNFDVLYASRQAAMMANQQGLHQPNVLLLTDDASRDFRQTLLRCQSNHVDARFGCPVAISGRATMCTLTSAFGASRKEPCVAVEDGH